MKKQEIKTESLDHYGLVAAIAKELKIVERIDKRLGDKHELSIASIGQRVLAMIINGLGFTDERLYMVSSFFKDKPVEILIGQEIKAEHLNDDALAKALDKIANYGSTKLFAEIAYEIGIEEALVNEFAHLDTTSFSLEGSFEGADFPKITFGFSKDHRPDLKQVILSLTTSGPSGFPLWMEALDGNSSDKNSFHKTIANMTHFQKELKEAEPFTWVADSALYAKEKLMKAEGILWITRVPESIKEAKELCQKKEVSWIECRDGYKMMSTFSEHGGVKQRWLLIYSEQAFQREQKTFHKRIEKEKEELERECWHLTNQLFACECDAKKALDKVVGKSKYHVAIPLIEQVKKHLKRGRPTKEAGVVGYRVKATIEQNKSKIEEELSSKGRFVLATNQLKEEKLSDTEILSEYKNQNQTEQGFRFLKDPWFMLDSFFLKTASRIEALMFVMTLCLMVYNVGQFWLRKKLNILNETLPNQLGKQIKTPTLRWIFKLFRGIGVLRIKIENQINVIVTNIEAIHEKILRFFGLTACMIYQVNLHSE